jgi:WD40 repeat protein
VNISYSDRQPCSFMPIAQEAVMTRYSRSKAKVLALGVALFAALTLIADASSQERARIEIVPSIGHLGPIDAAAFSPDGEHLLSASEDGTLKLWDVATGRLLQTFEGHSGRAVALAFSPNGARVMVSDHRSVKLWNTATGQHLRTFEDLPISVSSAVFSPDGKDILVGCSNGVAQLRDAETGRLLRTFLHHEERAVDISVAFSPDGKRLVTAGGRDGKVAKLWDTATGELIYAFADPHQYTREVSLAFSADGTRIAVGDTDAMSVTVWDTATGTLISTLSAKGDWRIVSFVTFSQDSASVWSAGLGWMRSWDAKSGQLIRAFEDDILKPQYPQFLAISPDGAHLVSGGRTLTLWDAGTRQPVRDFMGLAYPVTSIAVSPDGAQVLSASVAGTVRLWDVAAGRPVQSGRLDGTFRSSRGMQIARVFFSRKEMRAVARDSIHMELWDVIKGQRILTFAGWSSDVPLAFSRDHSRVASGGDTLGSRADGKIDSRPINVWDTATGKVIRTFEGHARDAFALAFSPDGARLASGDEEGQVKIWDTATGQLVRTFESVSDQKGPRAYWAKIDKITALAFSPDGRRLLSTGHDGHTMKLWDLATGEVIRAWDAAPQVLSLVFSPDGKQALSGGGDANSRLWDIETGQLVQTFSGHTTTVVSAAFSGDGRRVFSGSLDGTTRVWDPKSGELLATMIERDGGEWLAVTPEGFFDASAPAVAGGVLSVVRGFDEFEIDSVTQLLHRPDLVRAKLSGDPAGKVKEAAEGLDLNKALSDSGAKPKVAATPETEPTPDAKPAVELVPQIGHSSSTAAATFSPDGRYAVSGSNDNTLKLWDVATARQLRTFIGHGKSVTTMAFAPNGRLLLSGSDDNTVKVWDIGTGKELLSFSGHGGGIEAVAVSPDGRYALSASEAPISIRSGEQIATMKLWEIATGKTLRTFSGHAGGVKSVVISPDGRFALSGGDDKRMKLWELSTGRELRSFAGHGGTVESVAFSPDGQFALSGSADKTMKLWEVATGKELRSSAHPRKVTSIAYSADGRVALSGMVTDSILSADGRVVLSDPEIMTLWDMTTGAELRRFAIRSDPVTSVRGRIMDNPIRVALSSDGRFALSTAGGMRLWDVATGEPLRDFRGYSFKVDSLAFSPDGRFALSNSGKALTLWDVPTGKQVRSFGHSWWGAALAFSPDSRFVLSATHDDMERTMMDSPAKGAVAFSPDGRFALSGSGWALTLLETATGKELRAFGSSDPSASVDNTMKLWDVATGQELRSFDGHTDWVTSVAFSPDGRLALSGSRDRTIKLWEVETGKEVRTIKTYGGHFMFQGVVAVFSSDGRYIFAATTNGVEVWESETGTFAGGIHDPDDDIATVAFSPTAYLAVTAGRRGESMTLRDMTTGKELRRLTGHSSEVTSVAFSPDGRLLLSGSGDGTARIWDTGNGRERARLMAGPGEEWLTMTPEGFFSSSHRDTAMLAIVRGLEVTTIGQVHQSLFNPDLVREALSGDTAGEVQSAAKIVSLEKVLDAGPPPQVTITSHEYGSTSSTDLIKVTARIADRGKGIGRIEWRVNGITVGVMGVAPGAGPDYEVERVLPLDPNDNEIEVIAYERLNLLASSPARTTINFTGVAEQLKPKLHILAVGINGYVDEGWTPPGSSQRVQFPPLNLAVPDATAFAAAMRKAGAGLYSDVIVTTALNTDARADNLDRLMDLISTQVGPRDTFILYAAAHGISKDGRFYLIPQDFQGGDNPEALAKHAVGQDHLQDWIANRIRAKKALILLDTCESGALVSGYTRSRTDAPASEAAIGRLHEATGRPVLTAAASGKPAFEGYKGHGVFTYALIDALRNGDSSGNGEIELSEFVAHAQALVPKLSAQLEGGGAGVKGTALVAIRGFKDDKQSAHFGSTGEDFTLVRRLP